MSSCVLPTGIRKEGDCENERNLASSDLFKAIMREAFDVQDVICGHHIIYEKMQMGNDGYPYHFPQEIPSADALIFNHDVARKIWGDNEWRDNLVALALEPVATRDKLLYQLYHNRLRKEDNRRV